MTNKTNFPKKEYSIDEKVEVQGWVGKDTGIIIDIDWIYHRRSERHTWGYKIKYDNEGPGLAFIYVPEGYLRKYTSQKEIAQQ